MTVSVTISAMADAPPLAAGYSRANALATLGFAALTLGSLAIPWAASDRLGDDLSWSGFDLMGHPPPVSESLGTVVTCLQVLQWLSVGLIALSALRLFVSTARLAWATAVAASVLVLCAVLAAFRFHATLQCVDPAAPSMQAGPIVTAVAAFLCATAAGFGPFAQRTRGRSRAR